MTWDYFVPFAIAALHFWGFGAFAAWRGRKPAIVGGLTLIGLAIFFRHQCGAEGGHGNVG